MIAIKRIMINFDRTMPTIWKKSWVAACGLTENKVDNRAVVINSVIPANPYAVIDKIICVCHLNLYMRQTRKGIDTINSVRYTLTGISQSTKVKIMVNAGI